MPHFSLKWLMVAVAYVAVSIVALLSANDYWRYGFESAAVVLFLTALLGTILSVGHRRAFWIGWVIFGGASLFFGIRILGFSEIWKPRLISAALDATHEYMFKPTIEFVPRSQDAFDRARMLGADIDNASNNRYQLTYSRPDQSHFTAVGNALLCVPFALLGATIATCFWGQRERERPRTQ